MEEPRRIDMVELVRSSRAPSSFARHDDGGGGVKAVLLCGDTVALRMCGGW